MSSMSTTFRREDHLAASTDPNQPWDLVVVGGGATGAGIALEASTRGYRVLLLEAFDFGKGTSSRSTKLIHGGVRYLGQLQFQMVRESLLERGRLVQNAPQHVRELEFIIPCHSQIERIYYGTGLKLYDAFAFGSTMRRSHLLRTSELYRRLPGLQPGKFVGGVAYSDAQFDDARLLIALIQNAVSYGAKVLNYAPVNQILKDVSGKVAGVGVCDSETGKSFDVRTKCVVNATGPFCDAIRKLDSADSMPLLSASQGVHVVLHKAFFDSKSAMIVPKTSDGRVLFAIPWKNHLLVGTTDTPIDNIQVEPKPLKQEIDFLLDTLGQYSNRQPLVEDCLSVFTGIRPLVKSDAQAATKKLSRDHTIEASKSGLITITGGKWTTYRWMAEDCVNQVERLCKFNPRASRTSNLQIDNFESEAADSENDPSGENQGKLLDDSLSISELDFLQGVRFEFARTVEDLLARRTRALFLNAKRALDLAPIAADYLAKELGRDEQWKQSEVAKFEELAKNYTPNGR